MTVKDEARGGFFAFLKEAIAKRKLRVVLGIRSDFRDLLDRAGREVDPEQGV